MVGSESDTDSGSESASTSDEDDSTSEDGPASEDGESDAESARSAAAKAGKEREAVEDKAQPTGPIDGHLEAQGRAAAAAASDDLAAEPTTREKASVIFAQSAMFGLYRTSAGRINVLLLVYWRRRSTSESETLVIELIININLLRRSTNTREDAGRRDR